MATHIQLLLLTNAAFISACKNSEHRPEVTIADSEHLLVNWTNSFEGCDSAEVQSTIVEIRASDYFPSTKILTMRVNVTVDAKEATVKINPCLRYPEIKIRLRYNESDVWSLPSSYNNYNSYDIKIEGLYSGLLQNQVVQEICIRNGWFPAIPDIPEELKNCVSFEKLSKKAKGWEFIFEIVHPLNKDRTSRIKAHVSKECSPSDIKVQGDIGNSRAKGKQNKKQNWMVGTVVGGSILVIAIIITVGIASRICPKTKKQKNEPEARVDVNPEYAVAADYVYDEMGNDDNIEVLTMRKREVKAEVVDRSSIYGEKEEGWENIVAVDTNSYYGD